MCIITDSNHVVVSVSLIGGLEEIPACYNVYFPYDGKLPIPKEGDTFRDDEFLKAQREIMFQMGFVKPYDKFTTIIDD